MSRYVLCILLFVGGALCGLCKAQSSDGRGELLDGKISGVEGPAIYADMLASSTVGDEHISLSTKQYYHRTYAGGLLFIGAIGLLAFFILLLYLYNREAIYLYYFLFLFFSLIGSFINLSSYQWWTWTFQPASGMAKRTLEMTTLLALFAYCLFTLSLLDVKKQAPRLAKWITILAGINGVYGIVYWLVYPYIATHEDLFFIVSRLVILPMSLVAIVWVMYKVRSVFRSYFIIGSCFYFVGAFLAVLRQTNANIPFSPFYDISASTYFHIGIFLEIVCFALSLSHRVLILYEARQQEEKNIRLKVTHERDRAVAEVLSSRMQSNPHFIFNSLNAIKYLIQSKQNEKAIKSITGYSRFIRMVLDTGTKPLISLANELDIIRQYLLMESNRYERTFSYSVEVEREVGLETILLPPMILLPFIEEAIWNNLSGDDQTNNELSIKVNKDPSRHILIIDYDQKVGRQEISAKFHLPERDKISNKRIELHNKNHRDKINCFTENKQDIQGNTFGTRIVMTIDRTC